MALYSATQNTCILGGAIIEHPAIAPWRCYRVITVEQI